MRDSQAGGAIAFLLMKKQKIKPKQEIKPEQNIKSGQEIKQDLTISL